MAIIRLVNTTTQYRLDGPDGHLEKEMFSIFDSSFKAALEQHVQDDAYLDIQLVGREDMRREDTIRGRGIAGMQDRPEGQTIPDLDPNIPDVDILGFYRSHDLSAHTHIIKVCPERVMDACRSWNRNRDCPLKFSERYPTLLQTVIFHELAHCLMDDQKSLYDKYDNNSSAKSRCLVRQFLRSWPEYVQSIERDAANDPASPRTDEVGNQWKNDPLLDHEFEQHTQQKIAAFGDFCRHKSSSDESWKNANAANLGLLWEQRAMVEESLANAFVLKQRFDERHQAALRDFMDAESAPYKAGLRWNGTIHELLRTASSWRMFKTDDIGIVGRKWKNVQPSRRNRLEGLVRRLREPQEAIGSFDFQDAAAASA